MEIKGIKRGKVIEILENVDIPDGVEITLLFDAKQLMSEEERVRKINELFGAWKNQPELDAIFAEIDRERHFINIPNLQLENWLEP